MLPDFPKTAIEARLLGAKRYMTGAPCKHGHIAERMVANHTCVDCRDIVSSRCRAKNPERARLAYHRWAAKNPNWAKDYSRRQYEEDGERVLARKAKWRAANPEKVKAAGALWYARNTAVAVAKGAKRRVTKLRATPQWADHNAIAAIYSEAVSLTHLTGIPHDVDHIVPLRGKTVCGLHVSWNLRAIPAVENRHKGNALRDLKEAA